MNTLLIFAGLVCVVLGLVLHMNKGRYLYFVVGMRTIMLLALALLGVLWVVDFSHAEPARLYRVPIKYVDNLGYQVSATINNKTLTCVLDTGAYMSAIDIHQIQGMTVTIKGFGNIRGVSGAPIGTMAITSEIVMDGVPSKSMDINVSGFTTPCLIGENYFRQFKSMAFVKEHEGKTAILLLRDGPREVTPTAEPPP